MPDTAARLALVARRNEVCRFTIVVTGIDMSAVVMNMQVRLARGVPGAPLISLGTVTTAAAEGLKFDSVTFTNGVPTSTIKGRINQSTMQDATKVPYAGELGTDTVLAYAMQWTLGGDAQTRIEGSFIVRDSAFGSDNAPANRPSGYGAPAADGASTGALIFGDQIVQVSILAVDQLAPLLASANAAAAQAQASAMATSAYAIAAATSAASVMSYIRGLFLPGVNGGWWDPNDLSTLFADPAGTVPAALNGPVCCVKDKSGNGNHLTCPGGASAPTLKLDGSGFYLQFNGTTNYLQANFVVSARFDRVTCIQPDTYVAGAHLIGGGGNGQPNAGVLVQNLGSPNVVMYSGGNNTTAVALPLGQLSTITEHFFGPVSRYRVNNGLSTGPFDVGDTAPGGITIGCAGDGTSFAKLRFYGGVMIDRQLTEAELGKLNFAVTRRALPFSPIVSGDSIVADNGNGGPSQPSVLSSMPDVTATSIATPGDNIGAQRAKFAALPDAVKRAAPAVIVQLGINNVFLASSAADVIAEYQTYINEIRAATGPLCRIIVSTMTPANGHWDATAPDAATAALWKAKWAAINEAIAGRTANGLPAITGVDARITEHTRQLARPEGYLNTDYRVAADLIHPNIYGRRIEAICWAAKFADEGLRKAA